MTNFDKLIKEKRELVIDILSKGMCFDEDGEIIAYKDWHNNRHTCLNCKFFGDGISDCTPDVEQWLNEEVKGEGNN